MYTMASMFPNPGTFASLVTFYNGITAFKTSRIENLFISGTLQAYGTSTFNNVTISGNLMVNGTLNVSGNISLNNATICGTLMVLGNTTLCGTLTCNNIASLESLLVDGTTTTGSLAVTGSSSLNGPTAIQSLTVSGNSLLRGTVTAASLTVSGTATFDNTIIATALTAANATISGNLTVYGGAAVGSLTVSGSTTLDGALVIANNPIAGASLVCVDNVGTAQWSSTLNELTLCGVTTVNMSGVSQSLPQIVTPSGYVSLITGELLSRMQGSSSEFFGGTYNMIISNISGGQGVIEQVPNITIWNPVGTLSGGDVFDISGSLSGFTISVTPATSGIYFVKTTYTVNSI